jgi:hypothetical protein
MYLRIDENFATHPKTIGFVGRMQDPNAAMYLVKLWTWAVRSCPTGDLSGMLPWSIEDVVGYRLQDGRCYAAMVAAGFIDEGETGEPLAIHKWMERTGGDVVRMENEADRKRVWRLHRTKNCDPVTCPHCRPGELASTDGQSKASRPDETRTSASVDGRSPIPSESPAADDHDQGKARQVQARSGSDSLPSRGSVPPVQTPARSENRARLWPAGSWLTRFGVAWAEHYQQLAYGQPGDSKACGPLQGVLDALPESERLAAQEKAPAMFAEFLGRADSKTVERRHPFAFFVQEWGGLRVAKKPVVLLGGKPWQAADKAAEAARGADRAARRIAQENLDRLIAGEKATG